MFFNHLLIALFAVQEVSCKKFGGFRIKLFKKELSTNRLPLGGLFASSSDNSNGGMVGSEGGGLRGSSIGGGGSGGNGVAPPGQNDINFGNGDDDKKSKQAGIFFFLSSILKSYTNLLEKSPYPTKMVTSAIIGALGDYLVQSYEGRKLKKAIDLRRVIVFATVCGLYIAPVIHIWFEYLNTMPFLLKLGKYSKAFAMMFVDQSVGATVITLGFFFAFEAVRGNASNLRRHKKY
jgi:hypothetical protein